MSGLAVHIEYQGLIDHFTRWIKVIDAELLSLYQQLPYMISASIKKFIRSGGPVPASSQTWTRSPKMGMQSGDYVRALTPGQPGNIFRLERDIAKGYRIEYGIDESVITYARIQNEGGFIKHKGKMPYFFFWMYSQTGNEFWQIMGASALKKGGVTIPARPSFEPGIQDFFTRVWPELERDLGLFMEQAWERTAG